MNLYIRFGAIDAAASETADFVEKIDKLFDLLNTSFLHSRKQNVKPFRGKEYQINFLKNCSEMFEKLSVVNSTGKNVNVKFPKCFRITINGFVGTTKT